MVDETILRRLSYVKTLYRISVEEYLKKSDIEISKSVVSLDGCVEAYFSIILESFNPKPSSEYENFPKLLTEATNRIKDLDINSIKELHKIRNNIQHSGMLVAHSQASRYFTVVEKLLTSSCDKLFGIPWTNVSLSMLINEEKIAGFYKQAEVAFEKQDYKLSSKNLIMAFETAMTYRQWGQFGSGILRLRNSAESVPKKVPSIVPLLQYTEKIEQEVEVLKLGLEYSQWRGYRILLGHLNPTEALYNISDEKDLDVSKMPLFSASQEELEKWVRKNLPFVLESILRWQDSILETSELSQRINDAFPSLSEAFQNINSKSTQKK